MTDDILDNDGDDETTDPVLEAADAPETIAGDGEAKEDSQDEDTTVEVAPEGDEADVAPVEDPAEDEDPISDDADDADVVPDGGEAEEVTPEDVEETPEDDDAVDEADAGEDIESDSDGDETAEIVLDADEVEESDSADEEKDNNLLMEFLVEENVPPPPGGELSDVTKAEAEPGVLLATTDLGDFKYLVADAVGDWLIVRLNDGVEPMPELQTDPSLPPASPRIQRIRDSQSDN